MTKVTLYGLNEEVEFDETMEMTMKVHLDNGKTYDETAITTDGRLIAYDEELGEWVQLAQCDDK